MAIMGECRRVKDLSSRPYLKKDNLTQSSSEAIVERAEASRSACQDQPCPR